MLTTKARAALAVYAVVAAVHVGAVAADATGLAAPTQALLMPLLAVALLAQRPAPRSRLVRLTLAALAASWLGDTVPRLLDGDAAFLALVACFLVAQVCYVTAFWPWRDRSVVTTSRAGLAAYAVVVVGMIALCLPDAGVLAPAVVVYGLMVGAMAVLTTGIDRVAGVGGAVFLVSDGLIALDAFAGLDLPAHDVSVMATYVVAQALIVLGVVRRDARSARDDSPASSGRGSTAAADAPEAPPPPATHPR